MKDQFELRIGPGGSIESIYDDGLVKLAQDLGADVSAVCRASTVEWEEIDGRKGWVVRSAHDPELAIRVTDWCRWGPAREGALLMFQTREAALREEIRFFWKLLPKKGNEHVE